MKMWHGRIDAPATRLFETFTSSVAADRRLASYDVRVSRAHVFALRDIDLISPSDADALLGALERIGAEIENDTFTWRDDLEDVHTHVEVRLREEVGPIADALHTGRSRNDQIAADKRLYVKDRTFDALAAILELQHSLLQLGGQYPDAVMPGYTHLQQAQPVLVAHPLLAYVAMLGRDWERFRDTLSRVDRSPLGSGALGGTTFPLDRQMLAERCGFRQIAHNSMDAVSDRDFVVEFTTAAALCMTHLSRLSEDIVLWSSTEFGFLRLPDAFASGSSMMPQKKNPDVPELIRGRAALVIGDVAGALALVKGLPLSYNRDLQEDTTPLYHSVDTLLGSLHILAAMVPELEVDTGRTEAAISSFSYATDLADSLVTAGLPFREAHAIVGRLVAGCLAAGRELTDLSPAELRAAAPNLGTLPEWSPSASVRRKRTAGSTHPSAVAEGLREAAAEIEQRRAWLEGRR